MKTVEYKEWLEEFKKLSSEYMSAIDWDTVVWREGEIAQASDEVQLDAFRSCYFKINDESDPEFSFNPSISDWEHYDESCDDRVQFAYDLQEKWDDQLSTRL